jgi:serine/threonine protein phosphatase PrpC
LQAIIDRLKASYAAHRLIRFAAGISLGVTSVVLLATAGGFPPWAWRFLFQVLSQFPRLWADRGPGVILPFIGLLVLSLSVFALWGMIVLAAIFMMRNWLQRRRDLRQFAEDLAGAQAANLTMLARDSSSVSQTQPAAPIPAFAPKSIPTPAGANVNSWTRGGYSGWLAPTYMQAGQRTGPGAAVVEAGDELPKSAISLEVGTALDAGIKRKGQPNEDSLLALPNLRPSHKNAQPLALFLVADGMGGHGHGQEASHLAIAALHDALRLALPDHAEDDIYEELLAEGVHNANMAIYQRNRQKQANMGTTLTGVLIVGNIAYIANVGDSRTYLYREDEGLTQITRDHSAVARLVETGAITRKEIYTHPKRNEIYRSLGQSASVKVDTYSIPLKVGDLLLLCSDGLWEMVYDDDIERIIASWRSSPAQVCDALLQAALRGGGKDNISIIAARVRRN